jgi:adenylate kinase
VSEAVSVERLLARGEGRADDSPEVIKNRIEVYHQLTGPLVAELERQGRLSWVDGTLAPASVGGFLVALREGYAHAVHNEPSHPETARRSL